MRFATTATDKMIAAHEPMPCPALESLSQLKSPTPPPPPPVPEVVLVVDEMALVAERAGGGMSLPVGAGDSAALAEGVPGAVLLPVGAGIGEALAEGVGLATSGPYAPG
jgi:hypothetical protein